MPPPRLCLPVLHRQRRARKLQGRATHLDAQAGHQELVRQGDVAAPRHQHLRAQRQRQLRGQHGGQPGEGTTGAITCRWKGRGSSSHSRANWWHSRTIRAGPSGTHTSMARASGTQEWVKTGPVEQVGGVSRCRCPPGRPPGIPPSLTGRLGDDQAAAAEGQASVRDGAEGDEDLPPALRREAVEPHLPLRGTEWMSGTRHPGVRPHGAPQTHQRAARRPVPSPHLQPAGPVGTQLQEVELQPTDTTELCEKAAWGADTGGRTSRPFPPPTPSPEVPGPATPARTCGGEGQAHPQAGLAGLRGQAQPGPAQRQGGRLQRGPGPGPGRPVAAGAAQRAVG